MITALLIGRKGSQGLPGKNTLPVLGKPLAWYPMQAALSCVEVDHVFISTDDEALMQLAREAQVGVIERPPHLCTNKALGEDAFKHGYHEICQRLNQRPEFVVLLFCNAPTFTKAQISEGIKILRENPEFDSAVTVSRYNMWSPLRARKVGDNGLLNPFVPFETFGDPATLNCDRDSQGDCWFADVALSVVRPENLENMEHGLLPQKWMGKKIYPIKNEAGLDVDYAWQIPQVEWYLQQYVVKDYA